MILILSACANTSFSAETPTPEICSYEDLNEFITKMDNLAQRFNESTHLAENTSPENLEPIIKEMQVIRQEAVDIETPPCAIRTKAAFDYYVSSKIQCYMRIYVADIVDEDSIPEYKIDLCDLALEQLEYYNTQMDVLKTLLVENSLED